MPVRRSPDSPAPRALAVPAAALLLGLAALAGCAAEDVPEEGRGLVVLPADPAHAHLSPEEVRERGLRPHFHDFGRVPLGEVAEHVFVLRNTDPRPVAIRRLTPTCGCTVPRVRTFTPDGEPILRGAHPEDGVVATVSAGGEAELVVRLDTREVRTNNVDKLYSVSIATDSPNGRFLMLEMHVFVETDFQVTPTAVDLGRVPRSLGGRGSVEVAPVGDRSARVVRPAALPEDVEATLTPMDRFGIPTWILDVELLPPLELGGLRRTVTLLAERSDGTPALPVEVPVRGIVVPDVAWEPARLVLRPAEDEAAALLRSAIPGDRLRPSGARVTGSGEGELEVELEPLDPLDAGDDGASATWRIVLRPGPAFDGAAAAGEIVVALDHPTEPEVRIPYAVVAR